MMKSQQIARAERLIRIARANWHRQPSRMNGDRLQALLNYRRGLEEAS